MPARSRVEILSSSLQQKLELSLNISALSGSKISQGCLFEETYLLNESILQGERNICIDVERDENDGWSVLLRPSRHIC